MKDLEQQLNEIKVHKQELESMIRTYNLSNRNYEDRLADICEELTQLNQSIHEIELILTENE